LVFPEKKTGLIFAAQRARRADESSNLFMIKVRVRASHRFSHPLKPRGLFGCELSELVHFMGVNSSRLGVPDRSRALEIPPELSGDSADCLFDTLTCLRHSRAFQEVARFAL
jgi:hypothetical protein